MSTETGFSTTASQPSTGETTHNDRAITMTMAARKAACLDAGTHWARARNANDNIDQCRIVRLNALRAAGERINVACGREQLLFTVDGNFFCREQLLPHLPADMSIEAVQGCVHIANKMEQPVQTVAELDRLEKQLQEEFQLLGLLPSPRVRELQKAHQKNFFSIYVSVFSTAKESLLNLEKPDVEGGLGPMESWTPAVLDEFLDNAKPVKEQIARAERLRLGRAT